MRHQKYGRNPYMTTGDRPALSAVRFKEARGDYAGMETLCFAVGPADITPVHLHVHTEYSLLDGASRVSDIAKKAAENNMSAVAITDHGNLFGAVPFYKSCKKEGVKPILGCEVYITPDMEKKEKGTPFWHLVLLAQNNEGYKNLMRLVSLGYTEGFYSRPRVDYKALERFGEGLIGLSGCMGGEIPQAILRGDFADARSAANRYQRFLGDGNFYLEVQANGLTAQEEVNTGLLELGDDLKLPLVSTTDCHYTEAADAELHSHLLRIRTGSTDVDINSSDAAEDTVADKKVFQFSTDQLYFRTPKETEEAFKSFPREVLLNTLAIAGRCNVEMEFGKHHFPVYGLPEHRTAFDELSDLARSGLQRLRAGALADISDFAPYEERLEHELCMIESTGFSEYFLIVQDFINWSKNQSIPVGPGRGSGAGSLVAYATGITGLDPLRWGLLFERFINPERVSLPDIDVDFCERRRGEVIEYMAEKYGQSRVAQIGAVGTMKTRLAIRDAARALGLPVSDGDYLARLVPAAPDMTLARALAENPELREADDADICNAREILRIVRYIEGLPRQMGTHAAGLVCADRDITDYVPVFKDKEGRTVSQYNMKGVEDIGLVKFDFLGLKTLTIMEDIRQNLLQQGLPAPDVDALPLDDDKVYDLYAAGDTLSVFQMESSGMRKYLRQLKPTTFEDLIAMCALYRPGPLNSGMVDTFIKRKHGEEAVDYYGLDEVLAPILAPTYGVIVYQEQVMQIAQAVAGYTLGGADILRRAMGKKIPEAMAAERGKFMAGAVSKGIPEATATTLFDLMEKFAEYGFNKSHSAAYALISYQTAYLKVYHPAEFYAANMAAETGDSEKISALVSEAQRRGLRISAPTVADGGAEFCGDGDVVTMGLATIKGLGAVALAEIASKAPYADFSDFVFRINGSKVNKKSLSRLILSGSMDCFGVSRGELLERVEWEALRKKAGKKKRAEMDAAGFQSAGVKLSHMDELTGELETLGFYISSHPAEVWRPKLTARNYIEIGAAADQHRWVPLKVAGVIVGRKEIITRRGDYMAFLTVQDETGTAEMTVFPDVWAEIREGAVVGSLMCFAAKWSDRAGDEGDGGVRLVATKAGFVKG